MAAMRRLTLGSVAHRQDPTLKPEEFLRTLIEVEITARDESNAHTRMRIAAFPVITTLDQFEVGSSSIPPATFDYLASLEWSQAAENTCLIGSAGTG
jgi:DNA replication protein DnaC